MKDIEDLKVKRALQSIFYFQNYIYSQEATCFIALKKKKERNFQPTWDYSHCSYLDMTRWRFPKINVVKETYTYFLKEILC